MLSVCIPVYNWDVRQLTSDLRAQLTGQSIEFEIRIRDDGSRHTFKKQYASLDALEGVTCSINESNMGRTRIRNYMVKRARYSKIIFLDCDSAIPDDQFIRRYLSEYERPVVYGGTVYAYAPPAPSYRLHWEYGRQREVEQASLRMLRARETFRTNNFMADKNILLEIPFDEAIEQYGYEDNVWAKMLEAHDIPVYHIDNPVRHDGLNENIAFINKQKMAMQTLADLMNRGVAADIRIRRVAKLLNKHVLLRPVRSWILANRMNYRQKLLAGDFNLKWLDLYKLSVLLSELAANNAKQA